MGVQRGPQPSAAVSDNSLSLSDNFSLGCPIISDIGQSVPSPVGTKLTSALTVIVQPSRQPRPGDNSVAAMTNARRSLAITRKNRAAWSNTSSRDGPSIWTVPPRSILSRFCYYGYAGSYCANFGFVTMHGQPATTNMGFGGDDWKTLFFTNRDRLGSVNVKITGVPVPVAKKA
jgi:hypothetical protein